MTATRPSWPDTHVSDTLTSYLEVENTLVKALKHRRDHVVYLLEKVFPSCAGHTENCSRGDWYIECVFVRDV